MDEQCKKILDALNWLKSELRDEEHPKLTKVRNDYKIQTLKQLIKKLSE